MDERDRRLRMPGDDEACFVIDDDDSAQRAGADRRLVVCAVVGILAAWIVAAIVIRDNLRLRAQLDKWTGYAEPDRAAAVSRAASR